MRLTAILALCFAASASGQEVYQLGKVDQTAEGNRSYVAGIDGYSIRVRWSSVNPQPGLWAFDFVDQEIQRAEDAGLKVQLRVLAGTNSPQWAWDATLNDGRSGKDGPMPDPRTDLHRGAVESLIREVHRRYDGRVELIHVPAFGNSSETNRPRGSSLAGLSEAYLERVALMADLHGPSRVVVNHGNPGAGWVQEYMAALDLAGPSVCLQMNSLKASTSPTADHYVNVRDWLRGETHRRGFQMVGPSTNRSRFGGPFSEAVALGQLAEPFYYEVYRPDCQQAVQLLDPLPDPDPFERVVSEATEAADAAIDAALEQLPPERRAEARAEVVRRLGG